MCSYTPCSYLNNTLTPFLNLIDESFNPSPPIVGYVPEHCGSSNYLQLHFASPFNTLFDFLGPIDGTFCKEIRIKVRYINPNKKLDHVMKPGTLSKLSKLTAKKKSADNVFIIGWSAANWVANSVTTPCLSSADNPDLASNRQKLKATCSRWEKR